VRPVDKVLERLEGVRQRNGEFMALCPAHDDQKPSLSVSEGDGGKVLLRCFGGCSTNTVLEAAGLSWRDLYPVESCNGYHKRRSWEIKDAAGELVAVHHRKDSPDGKRVWWRGPNGEKRLADAGLRVADLPLYGSEHVADWPEDVPVVIVEGEKAADALASAYPAVLGTVTGAESAPGPEAREVLRGRRVILWPDADPPGRAHMERVAEALQGTASEVRIFEWKGAPEKGDAADHPAVKSRSCKDLEELLDAMAAAPVFEVSLVSLTIKGQGHPLRGGRERPYGGAAARDRA